MNDLLMQFIPLLIASVIFGYFNHYLARKKGYSGIILVLAWLPVVNFATCYIFIGLPDLILHRKIDILLKNKEI
jgi:hypothetical protein